MKSLLPVLVLSLYSLLFHTSLARHNQEWPLPDLKPTAPGALAEKIFPLFTEISAHREVLGAMLKDSVLAEIGDGYQNRVATCLDTCKNAAALAQVLKWTPTEIDIVFTRLARHCAKTPGNTFMSDLEKSNACIAYRIPDEKLLLKKAWTDAAFGMNRIYEVYIAGTKPAYAAIDSIRIDLRSEKGLTTLLDSMKHVLRRLEKAPAFYALPVALAIQALQLSDRDEAIRYDPIAAGINRAAYARAQKVQFSNYPYSAILTPGFGPEEAGVPIDARSIQRCEMAVAQFRKKQAPFIIVSGGHVYPAGTPFSEAVEMRKYLIAHFGISPSAIITEPYARHTTTNVRNAARLVYLFGLPAHKPVLVTTDSMQTRMVVNQAARCERELGYLPFRDVQQTGKTASIFYPVRAAFQVNVYDPLDP